mgnify:CR=1 FL=1
MARRSEHRTVPVLQSLATISRSREWVVLRTPNVIVQIVIFILDCKECRAVRI